MKALSQNRSAALAVLWAIALALIVEAGLPWHKKLFNKDDGGEAHANSGLADQLYAMDDGMDQLRGWRVNRLSNLVAQANSAKKNDNPPPKGNPNSKKESQKKPPPPPPPPPITRKNPDEAIHRRISQNTGDEPRRVAPRRLSPPVQPAADVLAVSNQTDDVTNRQWEMKKKKKVNNVLPLPISPDVVDPTSGQQKRKLEKLDPKPSRVNDQQEGNQQTNQFKRTMADLLKSTKNAFKPVAGILDKHINQPNNPNPAGPEAVSDRKALVRALLDSVNRSIEAIVQQYSRFTKTWTPNMERAINYIDFSKSNSLKWNNDDDANQRQDALLLLATGYEFMRVMIAWRQNMLTAHAAYRLYLETTLEEEDSQIVGGNFAVQLEAVHSYISFKAWLLIYEITLESRLKLDYLASQYEVDSSTRTKGKAGDFHQIYLELRESYERKISQFGQEQQATIGTVSSVEELSNQFGEVDEFLNDYVDYSREDPPTEMKLPQRTVEFMERLKSRIKYNPALYERDFLIQLKETLADAMEERYRYEPANDNSLP